LAENVNSFVLLSLTERFDALSEYALLFEYAICVARRFLKFRSSPISG
jgi:hypothetical protein